MGLRLTKGGSCESRFIQTLLAALVLIVSTSVSLVGCTQPIKEEKITDMNILKSPTRDWTDQEVELLWAQGGKSSKVSAKKLVFEDAEVKPFPSPVIAFVSPDGKANWIGPEQDFYLQDDGKVCGVNLALYDTSISWCDCLRFKGLPTKIPDTTQLIATLDGNVELAALRKASIPAKYQASGRVVKTDIRDCFADIWFFSGSGMSAQPAIATIASAEVQDSTIQFEIENVLAGRIGTVWIDMETRDITKAMENGEQTFPRDDSVQ